ncbi:MAG TPA: L-serine ammonia-lyase [Devosiaceae bacterium]|nr:L-serine ammonia-lyase [Devosiaceae bacterium]
MFISVFEMFKIGIGPSSSHTVGPMIAAGRFLGDLSASGIAAAGLRVRLYGSLSFTGRGHSTDSAICFGLLGFSPQTIDPIAAWAAVETLRADKRLPGRAITFDPGSDLIFEKGPPLPLHPNGLVFEALDAEGAPLLRRTYFSIGGGFVLSEDEMAPPTADEPLSNVPYPFRTAVEMLEMGRQSKLSIAEMKRANELTRMSADELDAGLDRIWQVMSSSIERGLTHTGLLPGGLKVKRRAPGLFERLAAERLEEGSGTSATADLLVVYAMAVNEENAAGGQIVTAPTNGAAGIIPSVLRAYLETGRGADRRGMHDFLLAAAAIGGIIKKNASISGAEMGCQGEVGSAAAMAAAGLCAARGGSNEQVENAAEIALEHHLGLTCDPVGGLVQIPCIERNGIAAGKAHAAAMLALRGDGEHIMPLDNCIEAMRQTGHDMNDKYKETSRGGLSVNLPAC